jgi:hypothetical protein
MGGSLFLATGLVSSAVGAAVAGLPWVALAVGVAAIPYLAIGVVRTLEVVRARHSPLRPAR